MSDARAEWNETCDLLVAGSGAAGLAAAVAAARRGLKVIVAEKAEVIGGTTAWSGGWIWAPCNPVARRNGFTEDSSGPRTYLEAVQGNNFNPELVDAFLDAAPEMIGFLEDAGMEFECGARIPDTYGHLPGAGTGGRSVIAAPYDGRRLGGAIGMLRRPMRETSFIGMTIQAGADLRAFMTATRSVRSAVHVGLRLTRHLWSLARYGRGMELRNGNALVARLMRAALDAGVELRTGVAVTELLRDNGQVSGAVLDGPAGPSRVASARGVVLACGGYPYDLARRKATFPHPDQHRTLAVPSATGDGLQLGEAAGGHQAQTLASAGAWCPVSEVLWPDGSKGVFPHIIERGKPGVIGVLASGRRFCNEGLGYYDYVKELYNAVPGGSPVESWLICDHRFIRRYGLGIVRPAPLPLGPWIKSGYLSTGVTLGDLARTCGIDPAGLEDTVARFNTHAANGEDPEFHRGTTPYMRLQGDPDVSPNPCLAPIETGPFYAVRVIPGSFGTFAGLQTDGDARVLDADGRPIAGLYAAGTDMASVMGGHYPAGGINLGPALTFGYIAGRHAAGGAK
ncbi:FAD-dependent oxidoreductase [Thalassobius vesicularis]|uniref:FAD-dependent oxidoreductase n=1 Tax=Thalassobius vesicularis TaxID=1294297 RepID=A0A4S3MBN9_9RHOB|nr:FAD-dependent oxidoreductase [Thalassobius vesicularis]THD73946.1 FAD-dependent oxidoreductase [Thalassobius vesicularis]